MLIIEAFPALSRAGKAVRVIFIEHLPPPGAFCRISGRLPAARVRQAEGTVIVMIIAIILEQGDHTVIIL